MLVDCSPVYSAVLCDTAANELLPFSVPFLLLRGLLAPGCVELFVSAFTDTCELEPFLVRLRKKKNKLTYDFTLCLYGSAQTG